MEKAFVSYVILVTICKTELSCENLFLVSNIFAITMQNELTAELKGANNTKSFKKLFLKSYFADNAHLY